MKIVVLCILVAISMVSVESAPGLGIRDRRPVPYVNPSPPLFRSRRSPEPQGFFQPYNTPMGAGFNAGYNQRLWDTPRTFGSANVGVHKYPAVNPIGLSGGFTGGVHLGREPGSLGTLTGNAQTMFNGPERRPSFGVGYERKIIDNGRGSASLFAGVQKPAGQAPQATVGVKANF